MAALLVGLLLVNGIALVSGWTIYSRIDDDASRSILAVHEGRLLAVVVGGALIGISITTLVELIGQRLPPIEMFLSVLAGGLGVGLLVGAARRLP